MDRKQNVVLGYFIATADYATLFGRQGQGSIYVDPFAVPHLPSSCPHRIDALFLEPLVGLQEGVLLAPEHAAQRLPHHIGFIFAELGRCDRLVELVGLAQARFKYLVEPGEWIVQLSGDDSRHRNHTVACYAAQQLHRQEDFRGQQGLYPFFEGFFVLYPRQLVSCIVACSMLPNELNMLSLMLL